MELSVAALVLLSAVLHPIWNALIKRDGRPEGSFLGLVSLLVVLAGSHALIAGYDLLEAFTVWPLILLSCVGQVLYGSSLVMTLKRGDLSSYYPIVRSSPLLIVAAGVLFLGQSYSWFLLSGIAMVLAGAFALQYRPGTRYLDNPVTLMFAVLAMSGTAIYSIADARLMQSLPPPVMFFWVELICLPFFILLFKTTGSIGPGLSWVRYWAGNPLRFIVIGVICYSSYLLILLAYGMGGEVAAVTSVRQASIPFSVLIGGLWLKESGMRLRLGASMVLAVGIVVIVLSA